MCVPISGCNSINSINFVWARKGGVKVLQEIRDPILLSPEDPQETKSRREGYSVTNIS